MNKILYFMLFVALTVGLSGCSSEDSTSKNDRKTINISRGETDLVRQNNDFALRLIQAVQDDNSQVVSPLSTTLVLAMLTNGADGETKQEICQTLGFAGYDMPTIRLSTISARSLRASSSLSAATWVTKQDQRKKARIKNLSIY